MKRRRRYKSTVSLPWEQRGNFLLGVFAFRGWRTVLAIGVAFVVVVFAWMKADEASRVRATRTTIAEVHRAIHRFRADFGRCPSRVTELVRPPRSGHRYLTEVPVDGWGRALYVRCPGKHDPNGADVISAGASGSFVENDNIL